MKSIRLDNSTYVHVYVHRIPISLEEAVISSETASFPEYEQLANEYIDALDEHWCVAFLEELHKVCAQRIVKHWEECAPQRLEEEEYKQYLKFKKEIHLEDIFNDEKREKLREFIKEYKDGKSK